MPKYSGLAEGFKTEHAEVHVHASRDMQVDMIEATLKDLVSSTYLTNGGGYVSFRNEFFDVLTAYANVILPGAAKNDLAAYPASKASFDKLGAGARLLEQA